MSRIMVRYEIASGFKLAQSADSSKMASLLNNLFGGGPPKPVEAPIVDSGKSRAFGRVLGLV